MANKTSESRDQPHWPFLGVRKINSSEWFP